MPNFNTVCIGEGPQPSGAPIRRVYGVELNLFASMLFLAVILPCSQLSEDRGSLALTHAACFAPDLFR
jgi:hypothetical protein